MLRFIQSTIGNILSHTLVCNFLIVLLQRHIFIVAMKRFLLEAFQDTRDQVEDVESMDQLERFLLDHTSFTDFPMLEGLAYTFELKAVEKEIVSFTEYRSKMYETILAKDFDVAGIDECVKDSQTKVCFAGG